MPLRQGVLIWVGAASLALAYGCGSAVPGPADSQEVRQDVAADVVDPVDAPDEAVADLVADATDASGDPDATNEVPAPDASGDTADGTTLEPPILLLQKAVSEPGWGADPLFPLEKAPSNPAVRASACGTVGVLFRDVVRTAGGAFDTSVVVQIFEVTGESAPPRGYLATAPEAPAPLRIAGTVVFTDKADGCKPLVWRASDVRAGYDLWNRDPDGSWKALVVPLGLERALGKAPESLNHRAADLDPAGTIHLLFQAVFGDGSTADVHAYPADDEWTIGRYTPPPDVEGCGDVMFGAQGTLHRACVDASGAVVLAVFKDGEWSSTVVVPATDPQAAFMNASVALGGYDIPLVTYTRLQRIEDGPAGTPAYAFAQLELATRDSLGAWTTEVVARDSDAYHGSGSVRFTGGLPTVFVGAGSIHVAFTDIAAFNDAASVQSLEFGQVRHAVRTQGEWGLRTVFRQHFDPTADVREGLGFRPLMGVSPNGKQASFLVLERLQPAATLPEDPNAATILLKLVRTSR